MGSTFSTIVSVLNIVCIALPIFIIVINILMGLKKGLSRSIVKIVRVVVSVVLAVVVTRLLVGTALNSTAIDDALKSVSDTEIVKELIEAAPSLKNYVLVLAGFLVAPILFLVVYLLVSLILLIPAAIVNSILKKRNIRKQIENGEVEEYDETGKKNKIKVKKMKFSGLFGMLVYAVAGFIISFSILMPFTNYVYKLSGYYVTLEDEKAIKPTDQGEEISASIRQANTSGGIVFAANVSSPLFNVLTDYTDGETKGNVFKDFDALIGVVPYVIELTESDFSDPEKIDLTPLRKIIAKLDETGNFKLVLTEVLSAAGKKWGNNEKFLGINLMESIGEEFSPYAKPVFDKLASIEKGDMSGVIKALNNFVDTTENVLDIISDVKALTEENFEKIETVSVSPLKSVAALLETKATDLTKEVVAKLLSDAGTKWLNGEEFIGLNIKDSLPEGYQNSLDKALELLSGTTPENVAKNVNTFADSIETLKKTYAYVSSLTDSTMTVEDLKEDLTEVLQSLTPESAEIIAGALTGEMLESANIPEESRGTVTDILSGVLTGVAELPEDQRAAEAEALNNLITYATDESAATADPNEVVSAIADSQVLSQQIIDYAANEDNGTISVSPEEQVEISAAIEEYKLENPDVDPELMAAIQSIFGIPTV